MASSNDILRSFVSRDCPGCGGIKRARVCVCSACWKRLPRRLRENLGLRFGRGYEDAACAAVGHLQKED